LIYVKFNFIYSFFKTLLIMKKFNFFGKRLLSVAEVLLLATMMCASLSTSAQVTIGSGALPQATLDIIGNPSETGKAFRLIDGNESDGKVLTIVGDNGIATWKPSAISMISGVKGTQNVDMALANTGNFVQTGAYITLPPGKWQITIHTLLVIYDVAGTTNLTANDFAWARSTFSDSPTATGTLAAIVSPDIVGGRYIGGNVRGPKADTRNCFSMMSGSLIIDNISGANKTYYNVLGWLQTTNTYTIDQVVLRYYGAGIENTITATPIQ
jgi:hypothetical protein